ARLVTAAYGHQTRPHILEYMSIVFWKFIKIFSPRFGGRDKKEKQKKSGNMGFKEFPRPLIIWNGGFNCIFKFFS
ncbi:hypothetical protein, partial [Schaedlerella arabinosiphila]|uniref:hypothetical protein n=1 Tax=Schaedlerella arabinosiphila TaxID=2044587 RepID=UPI0005D1F340